MEQLSRPFRVETTIAGTVAGWADVRPVEMRFPGAWVCCAGVAGVGTAPVQRGRGVCRQTMQEVHQRAIAAGYGVAALFGIPHLYHKFGYAVTHADHLATLNVRDLDAIPCRGEMRPLGPSDWPAVLALYDARSERAGRIRRSAGSSTGSFTGFRQGARLGCGVEGLGVFDGDRLLAYGLFDTLPESGLAANWHDLHAVHLSEVLFTDWRALGRLIQEAVDRARARRTGHIHVHGPPDDALFRYLRLLGAVETTTTPYSGGGMMRVLNLAPLLEALLPAWQERLKGEPPTWHGQLRFELDDDSSPATTVCITPAGEIRLAASASDSSGDSSVDASGDPSRESYGAGTRLRLHPGAAAQLFMGAASFDQLCTLGRVQVEDSAGLSALFQRLAPKTRPYAYPDTRF